MLVIIKVLLGVWFKIVCLVLVMVDLDVFRMVIVKGGVCGYNVNWMFFVERIFDFLRWYFLFCMLVIW